MHRLVVVIAASCAHSTNSPDDVTSTARVDRLAGFELCKSTFDDARAVLGEPYRDGRAHRLRVVTWKIAPAGSRKAEPLAIAFRADGVAVDWCYDTPGIVYCDLADRCGRAVARATARVPRSTA